jgi:hypothetical protein
MGGWRESRSSFLISSPRTSAQHWYSASIITGPIAIAALIDVGWEVASTRLLPATDLTIAGIVKHLAWAEDR